MKVSIEFFQKNIEDQNVARKLFEFYRDKDYLPKNPNSYRINISNEDFSVFKQKLSAEKKRLEAIEWTYQQHAIYIQDRAGASGMGAELLKKSDLNKNYNLF